MEEIKKEKILNTNVYFSKMSKFKSSVFAIQYIIDSRKVNYNALKLLARLLTKATNKYNSISALEAYKEELYNTSIKVTLAPLGDSYTFTIKATYIDDYYSMEGIAEKVIELVSLLIYDPFMKNSKFDKDYYRFMADKLYNDMQISLEKKEVYAKSQLAKMLQDSPIHNANIIDLKEMKKTNQEDVINQYEELKKSEFTFYSTGDVDDQKIKEYINKYFPKSNKNEKLSYIHLFDKEIEPKIEKNKKYSQSCLFIELFHGATINSPNHYTAWVFSCLLNDKLFKNVREKLGLCYSIWNLYLSKEGTFEIFTGIDAKNYSKALRIIRKQIDRVKQGKITKKEYKNAIESSTGQLLTMKDDISSYLGNLNYYATFKELISVEEEVGKIKEVKMEDVIALARKTKELTHYFLKGTGDK